MKIKKSSNVSKISKMIFVSCIVFLQLLQISYAEEITERLKVVFHHDDVILNEDGSVSGKTIEQFNCISQRAGFLFDVYMVDWARAQFLLKKGKVDILGFATGQGYRDDYAIFSEPVKTEKFVLVYLKKYNRTSNIPLEVPKMIEYLNNKNISVAMIDSSSELKYMKEHGLKGIFKVSGINDMVANLESGTSFAFIANLSSVLKYEEKHGVFFNKIFIVELPNGYYVNKYIISKYPSFMQNFNKAISVCKDLYKVK